MHAVITPAKSRLLAATKRRCDIAFTLGIYRYNTSPQGAHAPQGAFGVGGKQAGAQTIVIGYRDRLIKRGNLNHAQHRA